MDLLTENNDNSHDNTPNTKSDFDGIVRFTPKTIIPERKCKGREVGVCSMKRLSSSGAVYIIDRQRKLTCYEGGDERTSAQTSNKTADPMLQMWKIGTHSKKLQ